MKHEIIEIGLILIKQPELEVIDTLNIKVKPEHPDTATPEALQLNGYNSKEWKNSLDLNTALLKYFEKTKDAIFCAHKINFDLSFIKQACIQTGAINTMDYHCIDIPTLVWLKYRKSDLDRINLNKVAEFMGLNAESTVHRAINGATLGYEVLKKIASDCSK